MSSLSVTNNLAKVKRTPLRNMLGSVMNNAKRKPALSVATGFTGISLVASIGGSLVTGGISGAGAILLFIVSIFTNRTR